MEPYFSKFPLITYNNYQARNITERVTLITTPRLAAIDYHPYELANNLRADQLAGAYYNDPNLDWMLYIINGIVDPYYGWHLYDLDFNNYIIDKYGNLDTAEQSIVFFRNNWPSDSHKITPEYFNNLAGEFKKYYQPVWGPKQRIISYERRPDDMTMNTNKIVNYLVTGTFTFDPGDLLIVNNGGLNVGRAECISANATNVIAKNLIDLTTTGELRLSSNTSMVATITSVATIVENVPDVEGAFWEPVSYFDIEREANEYKRFIDVLDISYVMPTAEEIRKALISP